MDLECTDEYTILWTSLNISIRYKYFLNGITPKFREIHKGRVVFD